MRLFIALDIEHGIKDGLQDAVRELRRTRSPVRWVKPEGMHLTLKFLGETPEEKVASLESSLESVCRDIFPFPLTVSGLGAFPEFHNPRILWAGVEEPTGTMGTLVRSLEESLLSLGWKKEKRKFHPHVTVGRVKGNINIEQLSDAVSGFQGKIWGRQETTGVSLYCSHLEPAGARYEMIRFFPFGG